MQSVNSQESKQYNLYIVNELTGVKTVPVTNVHDII